MIGQLVEFILDRDGIADKILLTTQVQQRFNLVKDRSVFYGDWFAIRFCKSVSINFGNTVLGVSTLHKYDRSVYLIYVVGIDKDGHIRTQLCSMYNRQLLSGTRIIKHWAGRNSRGVTQYDGKSLEEIISEFDSSIDVDATNEFILNLLDSGQL